MRRFFQYLLLYGLLVVAATGLSGLLGRLLEGEALVSTGASDLARSLAFTVVGLPLFVGVALWSRRCFVENAAEARSLGWALYVSAASLTSLVVAMTGLSRVLEWVTGLEDYDGRGLAQLLVWGGSWGAHWWIDARVTPREHARVAAPRRLADRPGHGRDGSRWVCWPGRSASCSDSTEARYSPVATARCCYGLVLLVVGAPVWIVYWARTASRYERDPLWLAYVLLVGVGGGLVTAIASTSTLLYDVLVWLVGEPGGATATEHFDGAPNAAAAAVVGALVWWYHQALLKAGGAEARTEVRRVYEYLMAGIGLGAAAAGLVMVLAALVEAVTGGAFVGGDAVNTLLAALTLLAVGGPVWWVYWRQLQAATRAAPAHELASPTRRVYLFVLFGLGGLAAVVALIVGVYLLFRDLVEGTAGAETLRRMRLPIGVLFTTGAVAAYHWAVYRGDRERLPAVVETRGPRFVLLVGPADREIADAVARRTHGRVQAWSRVDDGLGAWSADEVMAALEGLSAEEVVVLSEADGPRAIPVHRG